MEATQTVAKVGPLAELAASLAILMDTIAQQQQEIKRLYEHINDLKKGGTQASSVRTLVGGVLLGNLCTYCEAVGRTATHRNNACSFDPRKMTDRKEWDRKLMDEKGVACKDDELRWGEAHTVLHRYPIKENLLYEDSLSCSPTLTYIPTPNTPQGYIPRQKDTGIVDSGATYLYISPSSPYGPPDTSAVTISVGTENGQVEKSSSALYY